MNDSCESRRRKRQAVDDIAALPKRRWTAGYRQYQSTRLVVENSARYDGITSHSSNLLVARIVDRCRNTGGADDSAIGYLPQKNAIDTDGLNLNGALNELLSVGKEDWKKEVDGVGEFFNTFKSHLPSEMEAQRQALAKRLG